MIDITITIDKLDKIGLEKVNAELLLKGLSEDQVKIINTYLAVSGSNNEKLGALREIFGSNEMAAKGMEELRFVATHCSVVNLVIDPTLARGLNYYTGIIFEAKAPAHVKMGSIGGGGRYDDLTGLFGVPGIPGVGISFGVDRIYDVLEELSLFPENIQETARALFFNLGEKESLFALESMMQLRAAGIACELFHETVKMDKQFKYADRKTIPYAIIIGTKEMESKEAMVKNLRTGEQQPIPLIKLADWLKQND